LVEIKDCSTNHDAYKTARHFLDRILNSTMAIRRPKLHNLKHYGAAKNNQADENDLPRISCAKQRAENRKRGEVFKTG